MVDSDRHCEGIGTVCLYSYFIQKYCYPTHIQPIVFNVRMGIIHMGTTTPMAYTHGYSYVHYFLPNIYNYK